MVFGYVQGCSSINMEKQKVSSISTKMVAHVVMSRRGFFAWCGGGRIEFSACRKIYKRSNYVPQVALS